MTLQVAQPDGGLAAVNTNLGLLVTANQNGNSILESGFLGEEATYKIVQYTFPAGVAAATSHTVTVSGVTTDMKVFATFKTAGTATQQNRIGAVKVTAQDTVTFTWDASRDPSSGVVYIIALRPDFNHAWVGMSGNVAGGSAGTTDDWLHAGVLASDYLIAMVEGAGTNVDMSNITVVARQAADTIRATHASLDPVNVDYVSAAFRALGSKIIPAQLSFSGTATTFTFTVPGVLTTSKLLFTINTAGTAVDNSTVVKVEPTAADTVVVTMSSSLDSSSAVASLVAFN